MRVVGRGGAVRRRPAGGCDDVFEGEFLCGENAVEAFEAESAFSVEEVRHMGLLVAGLSREERAGEDALIHAA